MKTKVNVIRNLDFIATGIINNDIALYDDKDNPTNNISVLYEAETFFHSLDDNIEYAIVKDFNPKSEVKSILKDIVRQNFEYSDNSSILDFDATKDIYISDERFLDLIKKNLFFEVIE